MDLFEKVSEDIKTAMKAKDKVALETLRNVKKVFLEAKTAPVITTLSKGTTVAVLNNSSSWYKVSVNGKEGYVSGEYLTGTTATNVALGTGTVKCSSSVNFRSAPNTSSTSYGELKNGTKVNVVGVSSGWYKVTYNGKTGYIHPDYITLASSSAGTAIAPSNTVTSTTGTAGTVKCSSSVNLRSEANTSSSILAELKNGTAVTAVSYTHLDVYKRQPYR